MQAFDGQTLEPLLSLKHVKEPIRSIDEHAERLLGPVTTQVVALVIDLDAAIAAYPADKGLPMESVEPAIRIDQARQWWQDGQLGACHLRRHIATGQPLKGALPVVVGEEALGHLTHLLERAWPMDLQTFRIERAMISFDVAIAVGTLRRTDIG
jgi:hypothetical protein